MPPRFFCETPLPKIGFPLTLTLDAAASQHVRVLRLSEGDALTLFDGHDGEAAAIIRTIDKRNVIVELSAWQTISRESALNVTLIQSLATGDKMDLIIQKAVELGVTAVIPLKTRRSTLKLDAERAEKRVAHWRGVAIAACEQCGRNVVPTVSAIQSIDENLVLAGSLGVLHPESRAGISVSLLAWARANANLPLNIMIGPEGGFSDEEVAALIAKGATVVTLGARVLRTETAGLAALAILQSTLGDLA